MNIFCGNLPFNISSEQLRKLFEEFGTVDRAIIVTNHTSGESRGFGFASMPVQEEALKAMLMLDGTDFGGRKITVREASPRKTTY